MIKLKSHESHTSTPIWDFTNRTSGARFHQFQNAQTENNQKKKISFNYFNQINKLNPFELYQKD